VRHRPAALETASAFAELLRANDTEIGAVELTDDQLIVLSATDAPNAGDQFWDAIEQRLRAQPPTAQRCRFLIADAQRMTAVRAARLAPGRWAISWARLAERWVDDNGRQLLPARTGDHSVSLLLDTDGIVLHADDDYPAALGIDRSAPVVGQYWPATMPPDAMAAAENIFGEADESRSLDRLIMSASGRPNWFRVQLWHSRQGGGGPAVLVVQLTELANAELDHQSLAAQIIRDPLTELFNRRAFLELAALPAEATAGFAEVLVVDIRRFKRVNDLWGQQVGDRCLIETAGWLRSMAADEDVLFRLAGSRFVLLCTRESTLVETLRAGGERMVHVDGRRILLSLQAGSSRRSPGTSLLAAAEEAEIALTVAKNQAWRTVVPWTAQISHNAVEAASVENAVQQALAGHHEAVLFQPLVNVARGRVGGIESLLRLGGPASRIPTDQVLATSHRLGLTPQFAARVYDLAFAEGLTLRAVFPGCLLGVNVSREFLSTGLAIDTVVASARRAGVALDEVVVELTEDLAAGLSTEQLILELRRGAELGMQMMIDDFGRGETSLSVLRKLPLSGVKLDKSLLPIDDDERAWDFVRGTVGLVKNFSGRLIAEGIETELQSRRLYEIGIEIQQGYFFGQPETSQHWLQHGFTLPEPYPR
jgi:diguanylate cyclase (GGDEF)-like protein